MDIGSQEFERLVAEALDALPEQFREKLNNVAVVVEAEPTEEQLRTQRVPADEALLGLYEGIPQAERDSGYTFVLPDKITLFRNSVLEACDTPEDIVREVEETVRHEIAHHFGISDGRLDMLDRY